jgi:hypothetical protein
MTGRLARPDERQTTVLGRRLPARRAARAAARDAARGTDWERLLAF